MISWPYQVSDLISQVIRTVDTASDWLTANLGTVKHKINPPSLLFSTEDESISSMETVGQSQRTSETVSYLST